MCTAISFKTKDHYFGRTLDLEFSYNETVTITPRNYSFIFRKEKPITCHYAIIGMAYVLENYPLYYDATNEKGLSVAGLNFPEYAKYKEITENKDNIAPFEFIPWILCQCSTVKEVKKLLKRINIINMNFNSDLICTPLHFIVSDKYESIVVEPTLQDLKVFDNPVGVLTNNPPFDFQMLHLVQYMGITNEEPVNRFSDQLDIKPYSRGMGTIGLPGDFSSPSRFVRAAFTKLNSVCDNSESDSLSQFYRILDSVNQQRGCCKANEKYVYTIYTSCCNTDKGIYYYTTYENNQISAVYLYNENLEGYDLVSYPLVKQQSVFVHNPIK